LLQQGMNDRCTLQASLVSLEALLGPLGGV
jgi:hypothetical protein